MVQQQLDSVRMNGRDRRDQVCWQVFVLPDLLATLVGMQDMIIIMFVHHEK